MSLGAVAAILALLIVPGIPAALAVAPPGRLDPLTRVALVPVLGALVAGLVAFILALGGFLSAPAFTAGALLTAVTTVVIVARRRALRAHARSFGAQVRSDPWTLALGSVVIVAIAAVRWTFSPEVHLTAASAWRYWADALEVADAGRIPELSLQYGAGLVPTVSKAFLNALNAGVSLVAGSEPLPVLGALLWVGSVSLAVVLWALGRELGLRWTAPLLAVLLVANRTFLNTEITTDLDAYRAETFGRLVAFGGLTLALHALRERDGRTVAVVAGAALGAAAGIHVVPVIVAGLLAGLYGLALLIREDGRRALLVRGLAMGAVAAAVAGAVLILPGGDVGLSGTRGDAAYERFGEGFDPTLFVNSGATPEAQAERGPRDWALSAGLAYRAFVADAAGERSPAGLRPHPPPGWVDPVGVALAIGLPALAAAALLWFPRPLRPVGLLAAGSVVGLVALTWWFSQRSTLFIPANFGLRRLYDYTAVPLVLAGLGILEVGAAWLGRVRAWAPVAAATVLVMVAGAWLVPGARLHPGRLDRARPIVEPMRWIAANLACDARILADQHSEGFFQAALGRVAILEGMTPYLRPAVLEDKVRLFLAARAFFGEPSPVLLRETGATHVVTIRGAGIGYPAMIGRTDVDALDASPLLRLVHSSPSVRVYEVRAPAGDRLAVPADFPGYDCRRDPAL